MIEHEGKLFDDSKLRPYGLSKRAIHNYYYNECEVAVVYGMPEGVGKSAYVNHSLADVYGYQKEKNKDILQWMWKPNTERPADAPLWEANYDLAKKWIKYPPDVVVDMCLNMLDKDIREPMFHWDDGGTWLYVMEFHDPFVINFMKYLPLARSNWGLVVISTPVEDWVLSKLRTAQGVLHVPIIKTGGDAHFWKPRRASCHKAVKYLGARKTYYPVQFKDEFTAIMPDPFYKWYWPRRKRYARVVAQQMKAAIEKRKARGIDVSFDETVLEQITEHIADANDKAVELGEAVDQKLAANPEK